MTSSNRHNFLHTSAASQNTTGPKNGLQAMMRSIEVCQYEHARLRFAQADLVIRPEFTQTIGTLEFRLKRHCIAAGAVATRRANDEIKKLLDSEVKVQPAEM